MPFFAVYQTRRRRLEAYNIGHTADEICYEQIDAMVCTEQYRGSFLTPDWMLVEARAPHLAVDIAVAAGLIQVARPPCFRLQYSPYQKLES